MIPWVIFWRNGGSLPAFPGGPIAWHAYELIYGFVMASIIGFLTTAASEFVDHAEINGRQLLSLVVLWLAGRLAVWLSGIVGIFPAFAINIALLSYLLFLMTPAFWRDPGRRQMSFIYSLVALLVIEFGFYVSVINGGNGMSWLYAATGVIMALIIIALSRISMRVINGLEEGIEIIEEPVEYLARPPRRNLAVFCISLFTLVEFIAPWNPVTGWLALAAAAAMLNLLNDWHIGRGLFNHWVFSMYSVYWLMSMGYALHGLSILLGWPVYSGSRHLLTTGAIGLSILVVMLFAGLVHTGRYPTFRGWMAVALLLLLVATLSRLAMNLPLFSGIPAMDIAGLTWTAAFLLYFRYAWRPLLSPRADGNVGSI
jgi:uncharacterized protein involved in response to NO